MSCIKQEANYLPPFLCDVLYNVQGSLKAMMWVAKVLFHLFLQWVLITAESRKYLLWPLSSLFNSLHLFPYVNRKIQGYKTTIRSLAILDIFTSLNFFPWYSTECCTHSSIFYCLHFFLTWINVMIFPWKTGIKTLVLISSWCWEGNRQEGQGSPNRRNRLQVPDIFLSLKRQEETNQWYVFSFSIQI